jgi:hypothetical protein
MAKMKIILFLLITSSFISLSIFSLESEKYHSSIIKEKVYGNTQRIEIQAIYLGLILEEIYPGNFASHYLYDMSFYNYNSTVGLTNSINIHMNANQLEEVIDKHDNHKKLLRPITNAEILNYLGKHQESREIYEEIYDKLSFRTQLDYKIAIWEIRDSIIEEQYRDIEFTNKIEGLIDKGKYEESQNDFVNSFNTYHKILLLDRTNINGLEGIFKAAKILKNSDKANISKYNLGLIDYYNNEEEVISYFPLYIQKNIYKFFENHQSYIKSMNYFYDIRAISWNERENLIEEIYNYKNYHEDVNSDLIQAQNYENDGKYEEALKIYDGILDYDKYFLQAIVGSAIIEQKHEQDVRTKVLRIFELVQVNNELPISDDEKKEKIYSVSKKIHEIKNNDSIIIHIYHQILTVDTSNKRILEDYAELLVKNELYSTAKQTYSKLLILDSENSEYINQMQQIIYLTNQNIENDIKLIIKTAENYVEEEKFEEALSEYNVALKLNPYDVDIQYRVTYANAQLGNESEVLILLKQYNLEGQDKAKILFLIEHYEEALKIYDEIFEKEKTKEVWIKRQLTSEKLYEDPKQTEKVNSDLIQAQNYENDGKYEESLKIYDGILDNDKFLFKALEGALRSSTYLDKKSETRKLLKISEILPVNLQQEFKNSHIITIHEIAKNYQNSGKIAASISIYRDLSVYDEFNIEELNQYEKILEEIQMYEEAIKVYQKLSP